MAERVVVIGGSVAGLAVGIGLHERGIPAVVLERDPLADCADGEAAFATWRRPGVTQFRQAHGFSARSRNLLLEHAPAVGHVTEAVGSLALTGVLTRFSATAGTLAILVVARRRTLSRFGRWTALVAAAR